MYRSIALTVVSSAALVAQTPTAGDQKPAVVVQAPNFVQFGPIGITAALAGPTANIQGAPYSAQVETQRLQILADGNRIEQTTTGTVARDSQGRVYRDEALPALEGAHGEAPHLIFIEDPVAGVHWTLDPRTKTANKMPFNVAKTSPGSAKTLSLPPAPPLPGPGQARTFVYTSIAPGKPGSVEMIEGKTSVDAQVQKTDLGTQNIEGVPAKGTRITRTIPAGKIGNALPIVITTETWFSPDLKVTVLSKSNDPRMGETTYRLTNIQRADPPASLFELPSDYTVKEGKGDVFFLTTDKPQK